VGVILAVDGGNSKTDVVLAWTDGEPIAYARGGGSNSHAAGGSAGCIEVIASLVERLPFEPPAEHGVFFLCGADAPEDIRELTHELELRGWTRNEPLVDNDTFALLRAGTDRPDAMAVICGAGINCVGRNAAGEVVRYPALGWETGDWGGAEAVGREALYHANRAADGRGPETALVGVLEAHFGVPVLQLGIEIHYRRLRETRLGEVASAVVDAARQGDDVAVQIVGRLAAEIVLLAERALRDLGLKSADVVLGGGMLVQRDHLFDLVAQRLPEGAVPVVPALPPVAGAVLAALDCTSGARFRRAFAGWEPA
jgi:N-acetylglucosamine kinase-like BadF-type ATPase